jgi:hypothetical protein
MPLECALSYLSGLHWVAPDLDVPTLIGTVAILHACNAVMCRLFAHNKGYPKNPSTLLGAVFGVWAAALLMILPRRTAT